MITLKNIVIGYKIHDEHYHLLNQLLTIISFVMYKAYYVSEQKTKQVNILNIKKKKKNWENYMFTLYYYALNNIFHLKLLCMHDTMTWHIVAIL